MSYGNYPDLSLIKKILVIKLRHHGDVLLTSPLFSQLKQALPSATIDAFLYEDTLPMLEGHPAIAHYLLYSRSWKQLPLFQKLSHEGSLLQQIRSNQYDLVLNLTEGDRGAIAARYSGAAYRIGLDNQKKTPWFAHYTHLVKSPARPRHTVEKHLDVLRRIGIFPSEEEKELLLHIPMQAQNKVAALLDQEGIHPKEYILIHPASRWRFKCLSTRQTSSLLRGLQERRLPIVLSSGPDPQEIALVEQILSLAPEVPVLNLAGKLSLKELSALVASCRALLCVDSVPLHIASATKTPVVVCFGPTSEETWGPWRHPAARVLTSPISCRPCYQDGCGGSKLSDCLLSISPDRILSALDSLLMTHLPTISTST